MYNLNPSRFVITKEKTLGYLLLGLLQSFKERYLFYRFRRCFFKIGLQKYNLFFNVQIFMLKFLKKISTISKSTLSVLVSGCILFSTFKNDSRFFIRDCKSTLLF